MSRDGGLLLSVDEDNHAVLINYRLLTVLHYFTFKERVYDVQFSPDMR